MRETIQDAKLNLTEKFYYLLENVYRRANNDRRGGSKSAARKPSKPAESSSRSFGLRKILSTRA